jgi:hypothetical protein
MIIATGGGIALALAATIFFLSQPCVEQSALTSGAAGKEFFNVREKPRTDDGKMFKPDWD